MRFIENNGNLIHEVKIISLNTFGGKLKNELYGFLEDQRDQIDIFCFQEIFDSNSTILESNGIRTHLFKEISNILNNYQGFYNPQLSGYDQAGEVNFDLTFGLSTFIKNGIKTIDKGEVFVHLEKGVGKINFDGYTDIPRNMQYATIAIGNQKLTIFNLHGLWTKDKEDNNLRIKQSNKVRSFMKKFDGEKILCGDFNLNPNTKSLNILDRGMKNLIKEFKITSTRSSLYKKDQKFADYMIISNGIKVVDFKVMDNLVSDHLSLYLEFAL
ncbi:hypothetical protein A3H26_02620 [candidate division WWE3 bacterium RIFCSPLOWO2_12_FULL_36_10]|uniref:Endonuclease/exonuclease/phosphatase domain-containing protein n=1 Tax=candidate division WWE3 bacterium RIFCSPLOWO2_12_FULL_36_10 TaxID=1802630 RepID=A0A1F4VJG8_UNCKA|nr:MAG: hypothetical protein A3H26_02620 [candidate division WWE3 bacterium RIFCSPLOWO2_12_FULL_36_10]